MRKYLKWFPVALALCLSACQPAGETAETGLVAEENRTEDVSSHDTAETGASGGSDLTPSEEANVSGPLTREELEQFETMFNQSGNYGFLLSDYQRPEDINLDELFYTGAGLQKTPLTDEERAAYLKALNGTEIMTDITRLTTDQIDSFLLEKTGITLKDVKKGLGWLYLPEYDSYYHEHGDTNIRSFFCTKGQRDGDEIKIWCISDGYSQFNLESIVTLKKTSQGYQYLSNDIIWDNMGIYGQEGGEPTVESLRFIVTSYKNETQNTPDDHSGVIFDSDRRYYSEKEIEELSWRPKLLSVMRNEIYARHGYLFKNDYWNEFFGAYTWYDGQFPPDKFDAGIFNEYEKANLKLVTQMER